jgi:hypothetical protein
MELRNSISKLDRQEVAQRRTGQGRSSSSCSTEKKRPGKIARRRCSERYKKVASEKTSEK